MKAKDAIPDERGSEDQVRIEREMVDGVELTVARPQDKK